MPKAYTSYEELLKDPNIDAVHASTAPFPTTGRKTIAALKAGKHVACTADGNQQRSKSKRSSNYSGRRRRLT